MCSNWLVDNLNLSELIEETGWRMSFQEDYYSEVIFIHDSGTIVKHHPSKKSGVFTIEIPDIQNIESLKHTHISHYSLEKSLRELVNVLSTIEHECEE